jgi:hypothetical protein
VYRNQSRQESSSALFTGRSCINDYIYPQSYKVFPVQRLGSRPRRATTGIRPQSNPTSIQSSLNPTLPLSNPASIQANLHLNPPEVVSKKMAELTTRRADPISTKWFPTFTVVFYRRTCRLSFVSPSFHTTSRPI